MPFTDSSSRRVVVMKAVAFALGASTPALLIPVRNLEFGGKFLSEELHAFIMTEQYLFFILAFQDVSPRK